MEPMNKTISLIVLASLTAPMALAAGQKKKSVDFKKLEISDVKKGKGRKAKNGDSLTVLYIGKFKDGKIFDANMDEKYKAKGDPFTLTLGQHGVIPGWEKGLVGAQEGMVRKLNIPWSLAYGERGVGPIPPKTDLVFLVKILKVTPGK